MNSYGHGKTKRGRMSKVRIKRSGTRTGSQKQAYPRRARSNRRHRKDPLQLHRSRPGRKGPGNTSGTAAEPHPRPKPAGDNKPKFDLSKVSKPRRRAQSHPRSASRPRPLPKPLRRRALPPWSLTPVAATAKTRRPTAPVAAAPTPVAVPAQPPRRHRHAAAAPTGAHRDPGSSGYRNTAARRPGHRQTRPVAVAPPSRRRQVVVTPPLAAKPAAAPAAPQVEEPAAKGRSGSSLLLSQKPRQQP